MFEYLVRAAVRGRVLVLMALVGILAYGAYAYREMPVDAFPDISPVMVPVFAEAHGMAPEEVERLITYPIEATMNGLPGVTQVKSTSAFGMAVIYVYFDEDVDVYFARQLVAERLAGAMSELPDMQEGGNMSKTIIQSQCSFGLFWFAGWLFSLGYLNLGFWKGLFAILLWPYFVGSGLAAG